MKDDVWLRRARSMKTGSCVPMVASVTPAGMSSAVASLVMLCDAQAQYGDYSELDECPMWGMWVKDDV